MDTAVDPTMEWSTIETLYGEYKAGTETLARKLVQLARKAGFRDRQDNPIIIDDSKIRTARGFVQLAKFVADAAKFKCSKISAHDLAAMARLAKENAHQRHDFYLQLKCLPYFIPIATKDESHAYFSCQLEQIEAILTSSACPSVIVPKIISASSPPDPVSHVDDLGGPEDADGQQRSAGKSQPSKNVVSDPTRMSETDTLRLVDMDPNKLTEMEIDYETMRYLHLAYLQFNHCVDLLWKETSGNFGLDLGAIFQGILVTLTALRSVLCNDDGDDVVYKHWDQRIDHIIETRGDKFLVDKIPEDMVNSFLEPRLFLQYLNEVYRSLASQGTGESKPTSRVQSMARITFVTQKILAYLRTLKDDTIQDGITRSIRDFLQNRGAGSRPSLWLTIVTTILAGIVSEKSHGKRVHVFKGYAVAVQKHLRSIYSSLPCHTEPTVELDTLSDEIKLMYHPLLAGYQISYARTSYAILMRDSVLSDCKIEFTGAAHIYRAILHIMGNFSSEEFREEVGIDRAVPTLRWCDMNLLLCHMDRQVAPKDWNVLSNAYSASTWDAVARPFIAQRSRSDKTKIAPRMDLACVRDNSLTFICSSRSPGQLQLPALEDILRKHPISEGTMSQQRNNGPQQSYETYLEYRIRSAMVKTVNLLEEELLQSLAYDWTRFADSLDHLFDTISPGFKQNGDHSAQVITTGTLRFLDGDSPGRYRAVLLALTEFIKFHGSAMMNGIWTSMPRLEQFTFLNETFQKGQDLMEIGVHRLTCPNADDIEWQMGNRDSLGDTAS